jgi:uncharacterized protein YbaR (Trm112 family)
MISPDLLQMLRCPWDPRRQTSLALGENNLVCEQCGLRFPIKDGFPVLVVEEAELPPGCRGLDQLPCQKSGVRGQESSVSGE